MGKVIVNIENGFKWYTKDSVWVKGAFFDANQNYYEKDLLPSYFDNIDTYQDFVEALKKCNGIYSVVIKHGEEIWCASDRSSTFPLFYKQFGEDWQICDDINSLLKNENTPVFNLFQLSVYKSLGHTFGNETLFSNIYQVQCAQAVRLKQKKGIEKSQYHTFSVNEFNSSSENDLQKKGIQLFENVFSRLVKSLNGRTAVIPLSGGFDSRMIAAGLKRQGYKKVIIKLSYINTILIFS